MQNEIKNNVQKGVGCEYGNKRIKKIEFFILNLTVFFSRLKSRIKAIQGVKSRQHCQFDLDV